MNTGKNNEDLQEALFRELVQAIVEEDGRHTTVSPGRVRELENAGKILRNMIAEEAVTVECKLHKPLNSMGSVKLRGKSILIKDTKTLVGIARDGASNFAVYPNTDGTVEVVLTYHGLTEM